MKKWMKYGLFIVCVTAGQTLIFGHYNGLLGSGTTSQTTSTPVKTISNTTEKLTLENFPAQNQILAVSDDGERVAYIDSNNVLQVKDCTANSVVYHLQLNFAPQYLCWVGDNRLFLGTEYEHQGVKDLRLSTVDLESGNITLVHDFSDMSQRAVFKQIAYSVYTNDVYVLIGSKTSSILYRFDTNGQLHETTLGGRYVSDVAVASTKGTLYFQDFAAGTSNVLLNTNQPGANTPTVDASNLTTDPATGDTIELIERNAVLFRVLNNTLYYGSLDSNGNVTAVYQVQGYGQTPQKLMDLSTPVTPQQVFITNTGDVATVSGNVYQDLTKHTTKNLPQNATVLNSGNAVLLLDSGNVTIQL